MSEAINELKEIFMAFGGAIAVLLSFVWIREFLLSTHRRKNVKNEDIAPSLEGAPKTENTKVHDALTLMLEQESLTPVDILAHGPARVNKIYIATHAGEAMQCLPTVKVIANHGIEGDRYCSGSGYWSESDNCEITLIAQENLNHIEKITQIKVQNGEHRRNIVTTNIDLNQLKGKRFRIGSAYFSYTRPRPPCLYIQKLTEPGMLKALARCGGICVRCFKSGTFSQQDTLEILDISLYSALKNKLTSGASD